MNKKNPLIPFLNKMADLMELIRQYKGPLSALSPELQEQLRDLTQEVDRMNSDVQAEIDRLQVDPKLLQAELLHSKNIPRKDKEVFMHIDHLKREAEILKRELNKNRSSKKELSSKTKKSSSLSLTAQRRKRFKPLGEDKSWIPL